MVVNDRYHLSYCTNIHAGESWEETFFNLKENIPELKKRLSPNKDFGIGLRLSNQAAQGLLYDGNLQSFTKWLSEKGLYVFTMNGFPYGSFHHKVVKDKVHEPDWTTNDRLKYTINLFNILEEILPEGTEGGISTSPISYKPWLVNKQDRIGDIFKMATHNIVKVACHLYRVYRKSGKIMHLDIEPEPDGLLENSREFINFYNDYLIPIGTAALMREFSISEEEARKVILRHITLCYDVCHFSLSYEKPAEVFERLKEYGIKVGKIQISAALKAIFDNDSDHRKELFNELSSFAESTYLHQVVEKNKSKAIKQYEDLPLALRNIHDPAAEEWRIHFHVPVFVEQYKKLHSTQQDILEVLDFLKQHEVTNHLEVETYTWDVLPEELKAPLIDSIQRELEWVILKMD